MKPELQKKNVVILGAARSGLAAAKLLKKKGAHVFVSDNAARENKQQAAEELHKENISYEFGEHSARIYEADFAVLSPGIPRTSPAVVSILSRNIPVYSELEIASWFCPSPIIAVTGSNGKTTTTTLLGQMIKAAFPRSIVAGNIGTAFSEHVDEISVSDWSVVEVSSFQLESIDRFHPKIALLLNLSPNHLDWYKTYEDYVNAKLRILRNLSENDVLIYNLDDGLIQERISDTPAKRYSFSLKDPSAHAYYHENNLFIHKKLLINTEEMKLKGRHNYQNAMAAALAADIAGVSMSKINNTLREFSGVEHRLEYVTTIKDVRFVNDSKATTIASLAVALGSFDSPIILIAGGKDKGGDYSKLSDLVSDRVRAAVLIGSAKNKMADAWRPYIPVHLAESLQEAIKTSFNLASPGDNVLLSPACSSYDMFRDFEDRGSQFKLNVQLLKEKINGHKKKK